MHHWTPYRDKLVHTPAKSREKEFSPLLHTINGKNKVVPQTPRDADLSNGLLSFDNFSESLESVLSRNDNDEGLAKARAEVQADFETRGFIGDLPLKQQQEKFEELKNEAFGLRLKLFLLEQHLQRTSPEEVQKTIKENLELHVEINRLKREVSLRQHGDTDSAAEELRSQLRQAKEDADKDKEDYEYQIRDLNRQLDEYEQTSVESDQKMRQLQLENEQLQAELDNRDSRDRSTHSAHSAHSSHANNEELEDARFEIRQLQSKNDELEDTLASSRDEIKDLQLEIDRLNYKLAGDSASPSSSGDRSRDKSIEQDLRRQIQDKQDLIYKLQDQVASLEAQDRENQQRIEELLQQHDDDDKTFELNQQIRKLTRDNEYKDEQIKDMTSKQDQVERDLVFTKKDLETTRKELNDVRVLLSRNSTEIASLTNERNDLSRKLADLRASRDATETSRIHDTSIAAQRSRDQVGKLTGELDALKNQLKGNEDAWKREREYLEDKVASLERMKAAAEDQLSAVMKNTKNENITAAVQAEQAKHAEVKQSLDREIERLREDAKSLKQSVERHEQLEKEHLDKIKSLETQLQEMDDDLTVSQSQVEDAERERDSALAKISGLETSIRAQENTLDALRDVNRREAESRVQSAQKVNELEEKIRELQQVSDSTKQTLKRVQLDKDSLDEKCVYLQNKVKKLQHGLPVTPGKVSYGTTSSTTPNVMTPGYVRTPHFSPYQDSPSNRHTPGQQQQHSTHLGHTPRYQSSAAPASMEEYQSLLVDRKRLQRQLQISQYNVVRYKDAVKEMRKQKAAVEDKLLRTAAVTRAPTGQGSSIKDIQMLVTQLRYIKARLRREEAYRFDLRFMKTFFLLQISAYQACNRADLAILQDMGIYPDYRQKPKRHRIKSVALMVLATVRLRKRHQLYLEYDDKRKQRHKLLM
uniref:ARAD1C14476p n=1 Tax=Blastobotrys adeninivorans TaxID=409370 RepID=A0A060T081_BLAAD